jgi:uncharacterized membrane protein
MSEEHDPTTMRLARALGCASLGLGVAMTAAPEAVCRIAGVDDSATARAVVPLVGGRELVHAAGLLAAQRPAPWVWTRVAGDVLDLTALGCAVARRTGTRRVRAAAATGAVVAITAVDLYTAMRATRRRRGGEPSERAMRLHAGITVNRPRSEVYAFWHDFRNLPRFMAHLEAVEISGNGYSHWKARGPAKKAVEWDAEITEDRPGELIAWRSTRSATVPNRGRVRFTDAPGGRGTEVRVELEYEPPGGRAATAIARLMGEHPDQQVRDDLRRFKQVMETGEVIRSEGSPEGPLTFRLAKQRPAQPLK